MPRTPSRTLFRDRRPSQSLSIETKGGTDGTIWTPLNLVMLALVFAAFVMVLIVAVVLLSARPII